MVGQFYHTLIHTSTLHTLLNTRFLGGKNVIRGNIFKSTSADFGQAVESVGSSIMPGWYSKYTRKNEEMKVLQSTGFTNTSDIGNVFCMSALSFKDSVQFNSIL